MAWHEVYDEFWKRLKPKLPADYLGSRARGYSNANSYDGVQISTASRVAYVHVGFRQRVGTQHLGVKRAPFIEFYTDRRTDPEWLALCARVQRDQFRAESLIPDLEAGIAAGRLLQVRSPFVDEQEARRSLGEIVGWAAEMIPGFVIYGRALT